MEIRHRISINSKRDAELMSVVTKLDIEHLTLDLPGGGSKLVTFLIDETDERWPVVSNLVSAKGAADLVETYFSDKEIRGSDWLRLKSTFEQGYPQPKSNWPIKQLSYEITCPECVTYKQINVMRLAKEPSLGKKSFMSLIWENHIFCLPEVFQAFEKMGAKGYEMWDAVIHKTGKPSEKVRQLFVPGIASPGLVFDDTLERKTCPSCGITKYYPHVKGIMYLKREALIPDTDFMLTYEWFGHGLLAWREILVSNRVANLVLDQGWQGVRFKVVELV